MGARLDGMAVSAKCRTAARGATQLTKTGYGVTFGPRGLHYTVHSSGRHTRSVGLPGTGLYWTDSSYPGQTASTAPLDSRTTRVVDAAEDEAWSTLTAQQFVAGYDRGDALYDRLPPG